MAFMPSRTMVIWPHIIYLYSLPGFALSNWSEYERTGKAWERGYHVATVAFHDGSTGYCTSHLTPELHVVSE